MPILMLMHYLKIYHECENIFFTNTLLYYAFTFLTFSF